MSRKHFSWLLAATLVLGALVLLLPGRTSKDSEFEQQALVPALAGQVNDVERVEVITAGNTTVATLQRQDTAWVVTEFGNYPADWPKLRELLAQLARAEIVEPKTSNQAYFDRLGVSDVANADSKATLLRLVGTDPAASILVGNAAEGRAGQYARLEGGNQALLIDQVLQVPESAKDWLQRDIINIADAEVVAVQLAHADGAQVRATRASADDEDFILQDIPEGREVVSAWSVNSMANALANLQLESVLAADSVDFSKATKFSLVTADGLEVVAEVAVSPAPAGSKDAETAAEPASTYWLKLSANAYIPGSTGSDTAAAESSEQEAESEARPEATKDVADNAVAEEPATEATAAEVAPDAEQRAAEINRRVSGWAYEIPSFKAEAMTKQMDNLLKALPDPE